MTTNLLKHARGLFKFHAQRAAIAATLWLTSLLLASIVGRGTFDLWAFTTLIGLASTSTLYVHTSRLAERASAERGPLWAVQVNGVVVARLPDRIYAALQRDVALDFQLYARQLGNAARGLVNAATSLINIIPLLAFWGGLALLIYDPARARDGIAAVANVDAVALRSGVLQLLQFLGITSLLATCLVVLLSAHKHNDLGFANVFSAALADRVRQAVGCAAAGDVILTRQTDAEPPRP